MSSKMDTGVEILKRQDYVEAWYRGAYSLDRYKKQMAESVRACRDAGRAMLLVDITELEGYNPTTLERFDIGKYGAEISRGLSKVAVVVLPGQVPENFASLVAQNRGLAIRPFTDRVEALGWLAEK